MNVYIQASEKLGERIKSIFDEKGITDESIVEVQHIVQNDYLDYLPENHKGSRFPVLGILDNSLHIGWREVLPEDNPISFHRNHKTHGLT